MISTKEESTDSNDDEEIEERTEKFGVNWIDHSTDYEVISQGDGGFNRVTRPDYRSAKNAAKTHEKATGNTCEIKEL